MEPVSNYLVAFGGNPQTMSALAHMGNIVINQSDRQAYTLTGLPDIDRETGTQNRVVIGSSRVSYPIREDMRLQIMKIVRKALQVNSRTETPLKNIRYPREEGGKKATLLQERKNWLVHLLKQTKQDAHEFAKRELENFFQQEDIDFQDPLGSLAEVRNQKFVSLDTLKIEIYVPKKLVLVD